MVAPASTCSAGVFSLRHDPRKRRESRSGGETGRLMLFTASPQGYSSLGSEPAGPGSGESRSRTGAASRGSDYEQRAVGLGPPTRPAQATGGREDSRYGGLREVHRRRTQAALSAPD